LTINTPYRTVRFLAVVGITRDELDRMKSTSTATVITELASRSPLLITDPDR
jgi:hypothetical protein